MHGDNNSSLFKTQSCRQTKMLTFLRKTAELRCFHMVVVVSLYLIHKVFLIEIFV